MKMMHDVAVTITQDNDSDQSSDLGQELRVEFVTLDGSGHFMRLHTGPAGWAIDDAEELAKTLRQLANRVEDMRREWEDDTCATRLAAGNAS